jgi:ribulose-phosphate 3-epimerase
MAYRNIELSPSVLCMDWLHLAGDVDLMARIRADWMHYDVCDSYFVAEFGLPFYLIDRVRAATSIPSDYHLMVEEPRRIYEHIPREENARVSIHYEACRNLHRDLVALRKLGFAPGVIVNPATTLDHIEYVIEEVDMVTIMTVNPGFPNQQLIPQILKKIERLREWRDKVQYKLDIAVDGNVSFEHIPHMVAAGAEVLVLGTSGLFVKGSTIEDNYERLREAIDRGLELRGRP